MQTKSGASLDAGRLTALALSVAVAWYFWDAPALLPLKLFVVMVHETGHAAATLLVGGRVDRVVLSGDEGGACLSLLPPGTLGQVVVFSAGYVGCALVGGLLLLATYRFRLGRGVLGAACVWLAVMGVAYAGDVFTVAFCLGTALVLGLGAWLLPSAVVDVVNLFLAGFVSLYALFDLRSDLWDARVRGMSDAALLAQQTYVPALVWAALWTVVSLAIVGLLGASALSGARPRTVRMATRRA
jgi:hypothetical protein